MERRVMLKLVAGGVLAPQTEAWPQHMVSMAPQAAYTLEFLTPPQNEMLDRLSDIIIPTDEHSPGAHEAHVSYFIDVMVSESPEDVQQAWHHGIALVDEESKKRFHRPFLELNLAEQEKIVARMAANEENPRNDLERFFGRLKQMTINGYYTSRIGIDQELQYLGNRPLAEFPGCNHPEHQQ
jgi:Gluconate 2-dehydrogenase subunit 3